MPDVIRRWPRAVWLVALAAAFSAVLAGPPVELAARAQALELAPRLTDKEFWRIVEEFSEPNGFFQSDNLVSNERPFQQVVPALRLLKRGGVYLGVAPDQNFTYIVALEPKIAFIVDIRRGNLHAHLMYKAIIELSADRADFLSRLFSRKRPEGLTAASTAGDLFGAYAAVLPDEALYQENLKAILQHLTKTHGFALTPDDAPGIQYVYGMFFRFGPALTYGSSSGQGGGGGRGGGRGNMPTYADLQMSSDVDGRNHAYLGREEHYQVLKALEEKNLIVPLVGDVAGSKALRAVGAWLSERNAPVTAYYTSNVEQYLFQNSAWPAFYTNVGTLPLDDASTFIRSARGSNVLDPIRPLLKDVADGRIRTYQDVTIRGGIR